MNYELLTMNILVIARRNDEAIADTSGDCFVPRNDDRYRRWRGLAVRADRYPAKRHGLQARASKERRRRRDAIYRVFFYRVSLYRVFLYRVSPVPSLRGTKQSRRASEIASCWRGLAVRAVQ
jgi:hypothetical protein